MSIETAFERVSNKISDAYTAVENKGGTIPEEKKIANLAAAIETIPTDGGGSGSESGDCEYSWWSPRMLSNTTFSTPTLAHPNLQPKTVAPATTSQVVTPDDSYDGLSVVTVEKIPDIYHDTSDATASASDILTGKTAYVNGGKVTGTASAGTTLPVPAEPVLQEKTATPTVASQDITPDANYDGLSKVTVEGIPTIYKDTSDATASASDILSGKTAYANGQKIVGTVTLTSGAPKLQEKTVIPTAFAQTVTPDVTYDGLSKVNVTAIPEEPQNTEYRWWSPAMSTNTFPSPYALFGDSLITNSYKAFDNSGDTNVAVAPPTSDADSIPELGFDFGTPAKISGIKIAGSNTNIETVKLLGNNTGTDNDFTEIVSQNVYSDLESAGLVTITFDPVAYRYYKFLFVEHEVKATRAVTVSEITFYREFIVSNVNLQAKTVNPSTTDQVVKADSTYDGLSEVTVKAVGLQSKTVTPTTSSQTVTPDSSYLGLSSVTVNAAPPSGTDTSDATATASDILSGKTAYVKGSKVTGSISTVTAATPTISVSSAGKITASVTQSAGYTAGGTKTATEQLTTKSAQTYMPTTSNQTISSGQYLTGNQTISGDTNLKAANIKSGVSIFGVSGSYTGTSPSLQTKSTSPTTSQQVITPDSGYDGLSKVTVAAASLTTKTVTPSSSSQTLTPSSSYLGFSSVTVNAIPASAMGFGMVTLNIKLVGSGYYNTGSFYVYYTDVGSTGGSYTEKVEQWDFGTTITKTVYTRLCVPFFIAPWFNGNSGVTFPTSIQATSLPSGLHIGYYRRPTKRAVSSYETPSNTSLKPKYVTTGAITAIPESCDMIMIAPTSSSYATGSYTVNLTFTCSGCTESEFTD